MRHHRIGILFLLCLFVPVILRAAVRYVDVNSANPTPPYSDWATAATTIQEAVDAAVADDEVVVANGTYGPITVGKAVMVRSVNGPGFTVINGGGLIRCVTLTSAATLTGFALTNGLSSIGGGAYGGTLNNCNLVGNSATGDNGLGGGAAQSTLNNCTLKSNTAQYGGGAYRSTLNHCNLTRNSASYEGGGAYEGTLNHCTLSENSTSTYGGGAFRSTLRQCILTGNSANSGGGASSGTLYNCTLTGNSAIHGGGADTGTTLNNCIVYYNSAPVGPNHGNATFNFSCTTPLPIGPGNMADDPLLASISHLSAQSPCIGRGSSNYSFGVDIDSEGWLDPPSMGADQFVASQVTGPLVMAIGTTYTNVSTGFVVPFVAQNTGRITSSLWDFGDGTVVSNRPYVSHAWTAPGLYQVRLIGYSDSFPMGDITSLLVRVAAPEVYYVNLASSTPTYPYTNWAGAATNIQAAIDAGTQIGRLVLVANGVYRTGGRAVYGLMTNRVVLAEGVEVRSLNGPAVTIIEGGWEYGEIRCAYVDENGVLSGFTLTKGDRRYAGDYTRERRGGGAWCEVTGIITNCILIGNSGGGTYRGTLNNCTIATNLSGGAYGSILNNCILSGNSSLDSGGSGGGASLCRLNNCLVIGNSALVYGGGVYDSILNNCTLVGNYAGFVGGGASGGTLNNCIVYFNTAWYLGPDNDGTANFNYSCTPHLLPGIGNIASIPAFVDVNNWSNLRLQSNSPCINAGSRAYAQSGLDLDGNPRITGGTVDIGAYEFQSPASVLSYAWAQQHGLPTDGSADYSDSDIDLLNNWQEWIAGTIPTEALSALRMSDPTIDASGITVSWQSVGNRTYFVERSANLGATPPFSRLIGDVPGQEGTTTYTDPSPAGSGPFFYRVGVQE